MMNFENKTVVVSGASGGMGMVLVGKLAAAGANLVLCSNDKERLDAQIASLDAAKVFARVIDVTDEAQVASFIDDAAAKFGSFCLLVNLAGLSIPCKYYEAEVETYEKMMDVNVKGSFLMAKHFSKYAEDPSRIINIGSMAARNTNANAPIYCMAKAAVNKLSEGLLLQLGPKGIAVTTVTPGGADTPFWGSRAVDKTKLMSAEEVADVIWFVCNLPATIQMHCLDFESAARFR